MAGLFATLAIRKALDKLSSILPAISLLASSSSAAAMVRQGHEQDLEDLRMLERTMHRIHATLKDAEQHWNIHDESAKLRLKELKELAYDAEDVVDEYEYELEVNRCKAEALQPSASVASHKRKWQQEQENEVLYHNTGMAHVPEELALKARKLIKRFHEIQYYSDNFTLSENDGERRFAPNIGTLPKTSSVIYAPKIIGREQDKDNIVEKLLSMTSDSVATPVSILAIVGMGGLGKTTLAQLVYNDSRIQGFFDMHAWVCVSEQFDPTYITKSIISSLKKDNSDLSEVCSPHETLAKRIKQKMVLLVLDDVWNERRDCWDLLCEPMNTAKLCMIIVTTRNEFFRLDDSSTSIEIPQNARYISIQNLASSEISITPLALRAIIVLPRAEVNINNSEALFSNCEKLRALVLGEGCLDQNLPALMGRLKLLRHLKLVTSFFSHSDPCWDHVDGLRGIGHLNNLLTLPPIHLRNDRIIELRSLNKLRELRIGGLGLHLTIDGAKDARLQSKRHLQLLSLDFGDCCPDHNQQVQLLESLRSHRNLRELIIMNYEGLKYPYWLGDASFSNLTQIELGYSHIQYLPTLGDLPSLVSLHIHDMMIVERIGWEFCSHFHGVKGFPSLTQLRFNWMPKWSEWSGIVDGGFPRLRTLSICHAHSLRLDNIESFPFRSLITLELDKCCCITTIPASTSLRTLRIDRRSFDLRRSSTDGPRLNRLPSLECLTVICHDTTSILLQPQHLPSLKKLNLSCEKLQYCDGLSGLTSLSVLKPWGCPKLPIHSLIPQLQLQTLDVRCSPEPLIHGISSMEAMGKYRCGVPCSWSLDLGKATAHGTNAHNLFGEMSSQGEVSQEDLKISEAVPINSPMNKEEKMMDEALDQILEKLEQMKTKRRCNEKIDRILEKLDEIEANRRKSFEETTNIIKATTSIFNSASSSTPPTSPTPVLAKCSWACSNSASAYMTTSASHNIDVPTPTVAMGLQVSLNHGIGTTIVTPTKCLVNCFDNDTGVNHAILEESFASTTAAATMETVVSEDKACSIFINTTDLTKVMHSRCTTISLKDNIGTIQAEVAFPFPFHTLNMIAAPKEPMLVMAEKLDSIFCIKLVMPNGCLMKCLKSDKRLLAGLPKRKPWPLPWSGGVVRGGNVWHVPWSAFDSVWTSVCLIPPWPPPIRLKQCRSWKIGVAISLFAWKAQWDFVSYRSCTVVEISRMHELALLVLLTQDPSDDKKDDLLPASKNPFTSYMMAQYFEVIESRLISDISHLDGNNVQDTWDCKGILVILEDGTSKWRMQGIKPSASKNIISAWKNVFIPTIKSVLEGDKQFCIYKPNISTYLLCHVAMPTILGRLKTRGTIVKLVVKYEHCEEGILSWSGIFVITHYKEGQ
uniref:NB-ARC domain-containing protein n=1 Tax=Oryza glumipatula TaxID=40148 RepID=A0A0E0BJ70_9ORYZ